MIQADSLVESETIGSISPTAGSKTTHPKDQWWAQTSIGPRGEKLGGSLSAAGVVTGYG